MPKRQKIKNLPFWQKGANIANWNDIAIPGGVFTRGDLLAAIKQTEAVHPQVRSLLESLMAAGRIVRVGRGRYAAAGGRSKPVWRPTFSSQAESVIALVSRRFPLLDFRVWELTWLNEFLNHLVARNTVLACIEACGREFVFDAIAEEMPGKVLLEPSADELMRYGADGTVAVVRLVSEAPRTSPGSHGAPIEQVAVDLVAEKLVRDVVPQGDLPGVLGAMLDCYAVDQVAMFRYARRRNKEAALRQLLAEADTELYT